MQENYINLYTKVENILHLDLSDAATTLEQMFPDAFVEPKAGIYILGHSEPVITSDKRFYELITSGPEIEYKPLEDIETVTGPIVDSEGVIVITAEQIKHKRKLLSNSPTIPASAVSFIRYTLMHEIHHSLQHTSSSSYDMKAESFLTAPRDKLGLTTDIIEKILSNELLQIRHFIFNKTWHIHWFRTPDSQLRVMQGVDFRVIEYYRLTQPEESEELSQEGYRDTKS